MPPAQSALGELWEQCLQWLRSAGVLDHHPREQFSRLADFAAILRNGVLLCQLALRLKPDSIDRHQILVQYQQSPFTCSKNIGLFLTACRTHFGIEPEQLFDEDDLYGLQNFGAVLRLLSQLSRSQPSRQLGLKPFPEETTLPSGLDQNAAARDDGDDANTNNIYSNLRDEVEQCQNDAVVQQYSRLTIDGTGGSGGGAAGRADGNDADNDAHQAEEDGRKIYDTICGQAVVPRKGLPISYAEFKPTTKREYCLKELLDKEINFTNAVQRIVDIFYARLHFHLNAEDLATIFINIRDILHVNLSFVAKLEPAVLHALNIENRRNVPQNFVGAPPAPTVAELFISFKERFTIYGMYCSQLTRSTSRINELERNDPEFKRIISSLACDEQFRLQTLLILPFQHITKYQLLLNDLAKYTTHDVAEQCSLNSAREAMKDLCEYLNEVKRDQEIIEYISTIMRSISGLLDLRLLDYGRLMAHDYVKMVNQNGSSAQRYLFVFEKLMMFCKRAKDGVYKKKEHILLNDFELVENELETNQQQQQQGQTLKYNHTLTRKLTNSLFDNTALTLTRRGGVGGIAAGGCGGAGGTLKIAAGVATTAAAAAAGVTATQLAAGQHQHAEAVQLQQQQQTLASSHQTTPSTSPQQQQLLNTFQLVFKSLKQRDEWKDLLKKTIETCNPRAAHAKGHLLHYKTYATVVNCAICKMLLRGQFFQGYHCSGCKRDMHHECACLKECVPPLTVQQQQQQNDNNCCNRNSCSSGSSGSICSSSNGGGGTYQRQQNGKMRRATIQNNMNTTPNFLPGETVIVRHSSTASSSTLNDGTSSTRLSCHNGDLLELLELNTADGTALGRLKQQPQIVGTIALDALTKMTATTLEGRTTHSRQSRRTSNYSLSDVITFQNPSIQTISPIIAHPPSREMSTAFVTNTIIEFHKNNPNVAEQPWYFGAMGRVKSNQLLYGTPEGTFIVRWSEEQQKYALSISVQATVRHMRLEYDQRIQKYFLHEERCFDTIIELINYYRINNLQEGFQISVVLRGTPVKGTLYRAVAAFQRTTGNAGYITLRPGDLVMLLDTAEDDKGWWRGAVSCASGDTRVGYFPATYVQLVPGQPSTEASEATIGITAQQQSNNNGTNSAASSAIASSVYQNGDYGTQQHCNGASGTVVVHEERRKESMIL